MSIYRTILVNFLMTAWMFALAGCVENIVLELGDEGSPEVDEVDASVPYEPSEEDVFYPESPVSSDAENFEQEEVDNTPLEGDFAVLERLEIPEGSKEGGFSDFAPIEPPTQSFPEKCELFLSRESITFDNTPVGGIKREEFFLKNISLSADCQALAAITTESAFKVGAEVRLPYSLSPGGKLDFAVTFEPTEYKTYEDKIVIWTNDARFLGGFITIPLTGYVR